MVADAVLRDGFEGADDAPQAAPLSAALVMAFLDGRNILPG